MTSISNLGPTSTGAGVFSTSGGSFDQNPFLQVLVTQLQSQTPLEPVDDSAFMQQMASFSSMEEQKQLNDNLLQLLNYQAVLAKVQGLSEGSALLGKEITYDDGAGNTLSGEAESVYVDGQGEVHLVVDGDDITAQQIIGVATSS